MNKEQEIVELLLQRLDNQNEDWQIVTVRETKTWPLKLLSVLLQERLLVPTIPTSLYTCTSCNDEHDEEVIVVESPIGSAPRMYIECPSVGRVRVNPEELRQWRIVPEGLVKIVGRLLGLLEPHQEVIPGRAWRMGIANLGGFNREVVLIRGYGWIDARLIIDQVVNVSGGSQAVVLLRDIPNLPNCAIPLSRVLRLANGHFTLDRAMLDLITASWPTSVPEPSKGAKPRKFSHSEDFRSWIVDDVSYILTTRQAQVAGLLFEAWEDKTRELSQEYILDRIGSEGYKLTLRDIFRNSKAWKTLIIPGSRRGMYRLNI